MTAGLTNLERTPVTLVFREVNERMRALASTFASPSPSLQLVCECERFDCLQRFEISRDAYDLLREQRGQFVLSDGDGHDHNGAVVTRGAGYVVVSTR